MKILFVTATRIGDAVLSTGALGWLVETYPQARFTIACGPLAAPLFEAVPRCERVIVLRKRALGLHWLLLWAASVRQAWSLVVDLRGGALGYLVLTRRRVMHFGRQESQHRVVELGQLLGLRQPPAPRIWTAAHHDKAAEELIPSGRPVLALGPAANWVAKTWPPERFAELARRLTAPSGPLAGARIAVLGGPGDRRTAEPVLKAIAEAQRIDLIDKVDLLTAAACLRRATVYVGNDSGLMHLAAAVGVPTVGLFGPSPVERYRPWGTRTAVVRTRETYDELINAPGFDAATSPSLMGSISVDQVEAAVRGLIQS